MQGVRCYNCSKRVPCHVLFANQAQFKIMEKLFSDLPHVSSRAHGSTSSKLSSNCDMSHVGSQANTKIKSSKRVSNMGPCLFGSLQKFKRLHASTSPICEAQTKQQQSAYTVAGGSKNFAGCEVHDILKNENLKLRSPSKLMSRGTPCIQLLTVEHAAMPCNAAVHCRCAMRA